MHKHYVRSATLTFKLVNGTLISTIKYETKLFSTECMHKYYVRSVTLNFK